MRGRHWDMLTKVVGAPVWPGDDLQLQRLLKLNILQHMTDLQARAVSCALLVCVA